jgi:hypothetical protein
MIAAQTGTDQRIARKRTAVAEFLKARRVPRRVLCMLFVACWACCAPRACNSVAPAHGARAAAASPWARPSPRGPATPSSPLPHFCLSLPPHPAMRRRDRRRLARKIQRFYEYIVAREVHAEETEIIAGLSTSLRMQASAHACMHACMHASMHARTRLGGSGGWRGGAGRRSSRPRLSQGTFPWGWDGGQRGRGGGRRDNRAGQLLTANRRATRWCCTCTERRSTRWVRGAGGGGVRYRRQLTGALGEPSTAAMIMVDCD